ncbi:MAG TPA: UDP-N-acetylmuramyl-tripeptide synthetase [Candidatus Dojkabacteria bacterium]|nr:UDP-N-acetylmuramyl-tripeptide synthetase [Candidatus Dojkabacteria bacterium]
MNENNPLQKLKNILHAWQSLVANFRYGFPYKKLKIIGVTGTDGKTTTTSLIYHTLNANKLPVGFISTITAKIADRELDTGLHVTTPDPWMVPKYLKMMVQAGIKYVVLESTSQGLQQNRLAGISYDAAVITNIKSDHLDYHVTWENYANAKFRILQKLKPGGLAVLNRDDELARNWIQKRITQENLPSQFIWYSKYEVKDLQQSVSGQSFTYKNTEFSIPLIGIYNLENALAAINICSKYLSLKKISQAIKSFHTPKGRMELIQKEPFVIIIDFAHTAHALYQALTSLQPLKESGSRIISVFGCAGKRDKSRREMGKISSELADITILTAEDPRNEALADVNTEILNHAKKANGKLIQRFTSHRDYLQNFQITKTKNTLKNNLFQKIKPVFAFDEDSPDSRRDAIDFALKIAGQNDIVIITGKAHEQSLAFGNTEYPWSDHIAVTQRLKEISKLNQPK